MALALVLLTGRRALPPLLMRIRPGMLRCWFLPADQETKVLGDSPALVESLDRLKRLHYFLLGVKVERLPWWGPEFREVALAARDHTAFASIVLQPFGAPASVYLYTPLRGGGMVFTRDYAGDLRSRMNGCRSGMSLRRTWSDWPARIMIALKTCVAAGGNSTSGPRRRDGCRRTNPSTPPSYCRKTSTRFLLPPLLSLCASVGLLLWAVLAPLLD